MRRPCQEQQERTRAGFGYMTLLTSESEVQERTVLVDGEDAARKNDSGRDGSDRIRSPCRQAGFRPRDFRAHRQRRAEAREYLERVRERPDDDEAGGEPAQRNGLRAAETMNATHATQHDEGGRD